MEQTYGPATWFKIFCWVLAVICAVFVVLLPGTIALAWLALKARIVVRDDRIEVTWFGTRYLNWSEISELSWARASGAIGAAMRPLSYKLASGGRGNIAIGAYEKSDQILQALKDRTRLALP